MDGDVERAVGLAREFLHRSGALRVSLLVERGPHDGPAVVECARLGPVRVTEGEATRELPHDWAAAAALPDFPPVRQLPPLEVDAGAGTVTAVLGGVEMLAAGLRGLAGLAGRGSVAAAEFETTDPALPLGLAARGEEPVVVLLGDEEFELPL